MEFSHVRVFRVFCGCTGASDSTCIGSTGECLSAASLPVTPAYRVFLSSVHPVFVVISVAVSLDNCTGVFEFAFIGLTGAR